jgi:8-oxo-dGTP pyrophosphatase MutT (NUDIX family)
VVDRQRVLLALHRKLSMWLPPGGHIEPNELPDDAAVREVLEETGVRCELVGERALARDYPRQLTRPEGIQLEDISPGHQHIDLVYFARALSTAIVPCDECDHAGWYALGELAALGVNDEIRAWSEKAVAKLARIAAT